MLDTIVISEARQSQIDELITYVMNCRRSLFPMINHDKLPSDLANFQDYYLSGQSGCFLQARDHENKIVGVIVMMPYDKRFSYLDFKQARTVEVARLFVNPDCRRNGLGRR